MIVNYISNCYVPKLDWALALGTFNAAKDATDEVVDEVRANADGVGAAVCC